MILMNEGLFPNPRTNHTTSICFYCKYMESYYNYRKEKNNGATDITRNIRRRWWFVSKLFDECL